MIEHARLVIPVQVGEAAEINYGGPAAADFGPLARDRILVRTMTESDLPALIMIDRRITGRDRSAYFERKLAEALHESDVRISIVAERDGVVVGFIMARVDRNLGVGRALISQLLINLMTLRVEYIRTEIDWRERDLLRFLDHSGFRPSQQLCFERLIETAA